MKKYSFYPIVIIATIVSISSCGADRLKTPVIQARNTLGANNECSYSSAGPAVCGEDGKDYLNSAHAECFTHVKHIGHCQCSNTLMVCGSDGADHGECEAIASLDYTIIKLVPCSAPEM